MDIALQLAQRAIRGYFGSSRGRRRRGGRVQKRRRNAGTRRSHNNTRSSVPTRSIMQGSFSGSIRNYFTVASTKVYYKTFTPNELIGDQFASLAAQFTEVRFNSCRVYFYPNQGTNSVFSYAACLFDDTSNVSTQAPSFGEILASPGSVCRRSWQTCGLHWKWTEPSDAEFLRISDSTQKLFIFQLATNGDITISGDLVVDASVILRNQTGSISVKLRRHIELLSGSGITPEDWNSVLIAFKALKRRIGITSIEDLSDLELDDTING